MIRIIKSRTDPEIQTTCPECGAVIGYHHTDIKDYWLPGSKRGWHVSPPRFCYNYIDCPSCGREIRIPKEKTK